MSSFITRINLIIFFDDCYFTVNYNVTSVQETRSLNGLKNSKEAQIPKLLKDKEEKSGKHKKPSQRKQVVIAIITGLFFIALCILLAVIIDKYQKKDKSVNDEPSI